MLDSQVDSQQWLATVTPCNPEPPAGPLHSIKNLPAAVKVAPFDPDIEFVEEHGREASHRERAELKGACHKAGQNLQDTSEEGAATAVQDSQLDDESVEMVCRCVRELFAFRKDAREEIRSLKSQLAHIHAQHDELKKTIKSARNVLTRPQI